MFSPSMNGHQNILEIQKSQELRRRPGTGTEDSSSSSMSSMSPQNNSNLTSRPPIKAGDSYRVYSGSSGNGYGDKKDRGAYDGSNHTNAAGMGSGSGSGSGSQYMQMQLQQQQRPDRDHLSRVQGAEKVEKAISQVRNIDSPSTSSCISMSFYDRPFLKILLFLVFYCVIVIFHFVAP